MTDDVALFRARRSREAETGALRIAAYFAAHPRPPLPTFRECRPVLAAGSRRTPNERKKTMRKSLAVIALGLALAMPFGSANATPPVIAAGGAAFASTAVFSGAVGFGAFATYMIATGQPFPLCGFGGLQCYAEYPGDTPSPAAAQVIGSADDFDHPKLRVASNVAYLSSN